MCGLAGVVRWDGESVEREQIQQMTDALSHRGPDGEGHWIGEGVGVGHRRLTVIDLTDAARQPMVSTDGRFVLSYNGEVYNFRELRKVLEGLGHQFSSSGDTEVVLCSLIEWGPRALERFNGMFALALWDDDKRSLLLARDRYGVKPLYTWNSERAFVFASEQRGILKSGLAMKSMDLSALVEYFTFQNILSNRTLVEGISIFPAGSYGVLDCGRANPKLKIRKYWDFVFEELDERVDEREQVEELTRLFRVAVERQLVADVEVGSYLSGGMDSTSIAAVASLSKPDLRTFTCGFDMTGAASEERNFDERGRARALSLRLGTRHQECEVGPGDIEGVMPILVDHLEEPRVGQSYPNYFAAQMASRSVKVVLSGAGGDELFGGYPWRYSSAFLESGEETYVERYYQYWQRLVTSKERQHFFRPIWDLVSEISPEIVFANFFQSNLDQGSPTERVNACLSFEAKTFLHGLLVVEDKLSMAHGLEVRLPFLDNDLVDFALRCPVALKLSNPDSVDRPNRLGSAGPTMPSMRRTDGKQILRTAMEAYSPPEITSAEKQGFSAPDASWFRNDVRDYVERMVLTDGALIHSLINVDAIRAITRQHFDGQKNNRLMIWSILNIEQSLQNAI